MSIYEFGNLNAAALVVPDLYVQIMPPSLLLLNGVPTSRVGFVGVASWGPVGVPVSFSDYASFQREFGALAQRTSDLGTAVALASIQGAQNMVGVRVSDGTDAAATVVVQTNGVTLTGKYTGVFGNGIEVRFGVGSKAGTWRVSVTQAGSGRPPEIFDNIGFGLTANALWVAIAAAINSGIAGQRSASQLIVATAGASVAAPVAATVTLTGGTDGTSGVTATTLVGADSATRTGMYALRRTGASVAMLADIVDVTTWPAQLAFGLTEGIYMISTGPAGQAVSAAVTAKTTAGIDSRAMKILVGDWVYWADPILRMTRMVSPQAVVAGRLGNLSPHLSGLNKEVFGIVATQRSMSGAPYGAAEMQDIANNGLDVITNPIPRGAVFGIRMGRNTSSLASEHGDNVTRMTNFIASTLDSGMGRFVGEPTSDESLRRTESTLGAFLEALRGIPGSPDSQMIEDFQVKCRAENNPPNRRALGYRTADVKVRYLSITEYFIVNLEGGQAVTIQRTPAAA